MELSNYKNLKKADWQELATKFAIEWTDDSVVRYLVEKIAEKIGVDDKTVSDLELKKQVCAKLVSNPDLLNEPKKAKATAKKTTAKATAKTKTTKTETKPALSRLEELRLECEKYGVAWAELHTEESLEQLLGAIKSAGVTPITNGEFEISAENVDGIEIMTQNVPSETPVKTPTIYTSNSGVLLNYQNIYNTAIKNHFRCLFIHEIEEMIARDNLPFQFKVNRHPNQLNKAEIILTMGSENCRVPSADLNDWILING